MNAEQLPKMTVLAALILMGCNACSSISGPPDDDAADVVTSQPSAATVLTPSPSASPSSATAAPQTQTAEPSEPMGFLPGFKSAPVIEEAQEQESGSPDANSSRQQAPFEEELKKRSREATLQPPDDDLEDKEPVGNILKIPL
jgi:hypothetical protein